MTIANRRAPRASGTPGAPGPSGASGPIDIRAAARARHSALAENVRARLGVSQERMATLLGVSFATINRWEAMRSSPSGLHLEVYLALDELLSRRRSAPEILLAGSLVTSRTFLERLFFLAHGSGPRLRVAYDRGARDAAELADGYNGSTMHGHRLGDCILAKMNLRARAPRRNKVRIDDPRDTWLWGFAVALVHMHGRLLHGADARGIISACEAAGVDLSDLRHAGVSTADLARLRRAGVRRKKTDGEVPLEGTTTKTTKTMKKEARA